VFLGVEGHAVGRRRQMCVRHSFGRFNSGLISDGSGDRGRRAGVFGEVHCDVRCLLFWDLARRGFVVAYRRFGITSVPSSRMRQWNKVHDSSRWDRYVVQRRC
jgi:hypothetical protein